MWKVGLGKAACDEAVWKRGVAYSDKYKAVRAEREVDKRAKFATSTGAWNIEIQGQ